MYKKFKINQLISTFTSSKDVFIAKLNQQTYMKVILTVLTAALVAALLFFAPKKVNNKAAFFSFSKASPKMTLWRVDSMHLLDGTKGKADLWPCDSQYYFNYHKNQSEDIIIEIKNEGDATLEIQLPLTLTAGSFGPVSILEQPHQASIPAGEEVHFIVRHTGGAGYVHSEAEILILSNDVVNSCAVKFEVGVVICFNGGSSGVDFDGDGYCSDVDCNDNDDLVWEEMMLYLDMDEDGYGGTEDPIAVCTDGFIPGGYIISSLGLDCDDNDFSVSPGESQIADNSIDDDCDGYTDCQDGDINGTGNNDMIPTDMKEWFIDVDVDGYADINISSTMECLRPSNGYLVDELFGLDDCDDSNYEINPLTTWYIDQDGDGFYFTSVQQCEQPVFGVLIADPDDCDDNNIDINPNTSWYIDVDNDGYPSNTSVIQCARPEGGKLSFELLSLSEDCDDNNADIFPTASEICNEMDDNCDGNIDEGLQITWYEDADGDGYGDENRIKDTCSQPGGYILVFGDCDDTDPAINPTTIWYIDNDNDGYTSGSSTIQCLRPDFGKLETELSNLTIDCNDNNSEINELANEICNGIDDNCNGTADDGITCSVITYYVNSANSVSTFKTSTGLRSKVMMPGTSWVDAFNNLQDALATAVYGDTIKVAQGTYYPDEGTGYTDNARDSSFKIPNGVILLGGYDVINGNEVNRDWECNKTILSGDIDGDGTLNGNCYHVVITKSVDFTTVVDGFCITGGNADGNSYPHNFGGGLYNEGSGSGNKSNPTLKNIIISNNSALAGGGIFNNGNSYGNSSPKLTNVIISGNNATTGGGMFNDGNSYGNSSPTLTNVIINGNSANSGGGMYNNGIFSGNSSPVLTNVIISGNSASLEGGGIVNRGNSISVLTNVIISGNRANIGGGLVNSPFQVVDICSTSITNSIFWNNSAATDAIISESFGSFSVINYSIIQAGSLDPQTFLGLGNKPAGTAPLFINSPLASAAPTSIGNFHVLPGSPAIDMGDNIANSYLTDLDGNQRIIYGTIDIGAYEYGKNIDLSLYTTANVIYVDSAATGANTGLSWADAITDLQDALYVLRNSGSDTVKVARGTYYPSIADTVFDHCTHAIEYIIPISRAASFIIPDSSVILGSYDPLTGIQNFRSTPSILCGDIDRNGDSTGNTYNVIKTIDYKEKIFFDHFVIQGGNAIPINEEGGAWWDGSNTNLAKLTIRHTIFRDNYAIKGGAFYTEGDKDLCIAQSEFYTNNASDRGGAIYLTPSTNFNALPVIRFENILIHSNTAAVNGGGIAVSAPPAIDFIGTNLTIADNLPDGFNNNVTLFQFSPFPRVALCNSILWNNGTLAETSGQPITITYSIVGDMAVYTGTGNKNTDPLFNPDYTLSLLSPAIDMGNNDCSNEPLDLGDTNRILFGAIDMGAFEAQNTPNQKSIVSTSYIGTSELPIATIDDPKPLALCEKVRFRLCAIVPESTTISYRLDDVLNPALEYIPGSAKVSYLANTLPSLSGDFSGIMNELTPGFVFPAPRVNYNSGTGLLSFDMGSIINNDGDADEEKIIVEFDAIVKNNPANIASIISNEFNVVIDEGLPTEVIINSNAVYMTLVQAPKTNYYVDSSIAISGDGSSWLAAFKNLQDALKVCNPDTIFVAQGTYYPDQGAGLTNNDRNLSFSIPDSAVLLGGYLSGGSETRDWECNKTILCGDIDGDGTLTGNSYHLVYTKNVDSTTVVDGFCITGGNADGIGLQSFGGGWHNDGSGSGNKSNPTLNNIIISGNRADFGGGMFNYAFGSGNSSPVLTNVIIRDNSADIRGGGMYNNGNASGNSSPKLTNVIISGNKARDSGGGMVNFGNSGNCSPKLTNVIVSGNRAGIEDGGMLGTGGGMFNFGNTNLIITNSIFWNNDAFTDSIISENDGSATNITYSIIQSGSLDAGTTLGAGNKPQGTDPLFVNAPLASAAPTKEGDFHVKYLSPAINMGDNMANNYPIDLDGNPRKINTIDIGSYEFGKVYDCNLFTDVIYVDSSATGANNGTSWADAFTDLQYALAVVRFGCVDTVKVAQGTYYPSDTTVIFDKCSGEPIDTILPDRAVSFNIPDSAVLLGGYLGGGSETRDWKCNKTILCGDIDGDGTLTGNSYHVVVTTNVDSTTVVDGFCITGGNADGNLPPNNNGGGWFNDGFGAGNRSYPTIRNVIIRGNSVSNVGGGMFNNGEGGNSSPVLTNVIITGNNATGGGGMYNNGGGGNSNPVLTNVIITGNNALAGGGGMFNNGGGSGNSNPVLTNVIISGNTTLKGGGMFNNGFDGNSNPVLTNVIISGNKALQEGGGMYNFGISGNCNPIVINSVFWNNAAPSDSIISENSSSTFITNGIIQSGSLDLGTILGAGNKPQGTDPLFVNAPLASAAPTIEGDFHVLTGSQAINMGDDLANNYLTDLDGNTRKLNTIDIGAYEFGKGYDCNLYSDVVYVDSSATGANNGTSWADAFTDLQDALAVVRFGCVDTVKVAQGTYYPSDTVVIFDRCSGLPIDTILPDRAVSFNIPDSAVLLGGYGGVYAGVDSNSRDWKCNKTILCGDIDHNGDTMNNSYHVVVTINVDSTTVVDGFCITGGNANSTIFPNERGGGWYNDGSGDGNYSNPTLINLVISGNAAKNYGGGMYNRGEINGESSPRLTNVVISGNTANSGAGLANNAKIGNSSKPILSNVVINGNKANIDGGGMRNVGDVSPIVTNSIFWNNAAPTDPIISENIGSSTIIKYSIIQSGIIDANTNVSDPTNKIGVDPLFGNAPLASAAPIKDGDFHVFYLSPAINMGDDAANMESTDLDGLPRKSNTIDIGVYEYQTPDCNVYETNILYVDSSLTTGNFDGSTWMNAFTCLQDALEVAYFCDGIDTIKVARGTYYPSKPDTIIDECNGAITITPISRNDFFFLPDGITLLGGYPNCIAGVTDPPRDPHCHITVLSGDIDHNGDSSGNTYNVIKTIQFADTILFDGFIVEQGNAIPNGEEGGGWWSGSNNPSAKLIIRNTIFRNNYAVKGAGMYTEGVSDLCITASEFYSNEVNDRGGAFYALPWGGGGIDTPNIKLENVLMYDNKAAINGGAIGISAPPLLDLVLINNTLTLNSPDALNNNTPGKVSIYNSIIWNNGASFTGPTAPTVENTIVQGGFMGTNIKDMDPLFIDPVSNFRLTASSPAIDMGDNTVVTDTTDLDGLPRIVANIVDMGAYENLLICTPDTIYVEADGDVPPLSLDSIIGAELSPECMLIINGVEVTEAIPFDCDDLGDNPLDILIIKPNCGVPDTLYSCTKIVTVLDTFPKELIGSDQVNVSLDAMCMHVVTADDVLKNVLGCRNAFEVTLSYPFGTNTYTPANKIDRSHLGYCMVYTVTEVATGNKTWGKLCVEDKAPPFIDCRADTVTCFQIAQLPQGSYTINDNCDNPVKVSVVGEQFIDYGCDSAIQGRVFRRLIAKDAWGNSIDCNKEYVIKRISLDSIVCARDTSVDCALATIKIDGKNVSILDPKRSGAPKVQINGKLVLLWPNNPSCKMSVTYKDERYDICGNASVVFKVRREWLIVDWCTGKEKVCVQYITVEDKTEPVPTNRTMPTVAANAHECGAYITLDTLKVDDCSKVNQAYNLVYKREGKEYVEQGRLLPNTRIWVPTGRYRINVLLADDCKNNSKGYIDVSVEDITPPTPICDEFTQVTVDPQSCWAAVAAKDLDNGSRDNCCDVLHFAAAHMDSITYWRNYWNEKLETEVGKTEYWKDKSEYDKLIEEWINCYVFDDTVYFSECGSNQVVLRVYEACNMPRLDPHIWPCGTHAWYCYNNYRYLSDFNFNWFDPAGTKSCDFRIPLVSLAKLRERQIGYLNKDYHIARFGGNPFSTCIGTNKSPDIQSNFICPERLYNDCMVNVLVDDKQAPTVYGLEDITIYCDGAPGWADYADCGYGDRYTSSTWPGELKDKKGIIHGYYGGSEYLGIHVNESDHNDPEACQASKGWAPIYCKDWLYLDSFPVPSGDQAGHVNYESYFDKVVLFDKTRAKRELKANEFSFYDNCRLDDASLVVTNAGTVNGCGEGWISRTWTIKDKCGNSVSATQKILVKHRSDFEVIFPEDKVVTCDFFNRTDTSALGAGKPYISDDECEQVGVQYKDEIFEIEDSACYKIVRTWTLIDWCIYVPEAPNRHPDVIVDDRLRANSSDRSCVYRNIKDNGDGYMKYVQIIKVIDEIAPIFTCTDNTTCITAGCDATVNIPLSATDNCTDASDIKIRAEITKPDATVERRNDIKAITGKFTAGVYTIKLTANDKCGNETTCTMTLTVKDCKKPTPYCIDGIATVVMPSTGSVEIWAKDFDRGAEDNCPGALTYSFTTDKTKASRVITCADIPNGREALIQVSVYVTDAADNQDFCKVSLKVQDNSSTEFPGGACKDTNALVANINGKLVTEENEGVENARVEIKSSISPTVTYMSKVDGSYSFGEMSMTNGYTIKALRDDEPMNGVSTLDLVNIQKHVLGTELLKSPYKMIAADVNNDKDITAVDLLELRKLILGIYDKLPDNTSWKFVPKSYVFSDVNNPWSYPTEEALADMKESLTKDFIGIKVGDVNASAVPHSLMGTEIRSTETGLILEVEDRVFRKGDAVTINFNSPNFAGISGLQGTLQFTNSELRLTNLNAGALNVSDKNIGTRWMHEGLITMSWNEKTGIDIEANKVLFTMNFVAEKDGKLSEVMRIGSQRTKAESYEGVGELGNLSIRFVDKSGREISGSNTLYQNYPNPFDQRTVIGINLAQSTEGILKVTDVAGRVIKSFDREWNKGYNEVWLDRREIIATGVLFYTFESKMYTASKRMIILE